jgi:hypothetical protein
MVLANRMTGAARIRCGGGALLLCLLGSGALAGSEQFGAPASVGLPLGSFESAGVAVFVRAHEVRRQFVLPTARAASLAYIPVASGVSVGDIATSTRPEIDMPASTGSAARSRWIAPSDLSARPGALQARDPIEVTAPFAKSGLLENHPTPDLEVEVSKRARLGVFGEANKIEGTDIRNSTVRSTRDLGAGVTLQYRFGE